MINHVIDPSPLREAKYDTEAAGHEGNAREIIKSQDSRPSGDDPQTVNPRWSPPFSVQEMFIEEQKRAGVWRRTRAPPSHSTNVRSRSAGAGSSRPGSGPGPPVSAHHSRLTCSTSASTSKLGCLRCEFRMARDKSVAPFTSPQCII